MSQLGELIKEDLLGGMSEEVKYLSIHARKYRSPMVERARCLVESLFLLTLGQDFFLGTRADGRLLLDDM